MKLGFTGTQSGMTDEQHREMCMRIQRDDPTEFHHGCCIGADSEAFEIVQSWAKQAKTVAHPPTNRNKVSVNSIVFSDEKRPDKPYMDRNQGIVDESDHLYATPKTDEEKLRSGTWATVRRARKKGIPITIF